MRILTAALAALLLSACAADAQQTSATAPSAITAPDASASLETFTSDSNGFDTHSYWLDTGREVVVFDAQFTADYANQLIAQIKAKTTSPIRWVVVTHPNPDKFNGATAFQKIGAKVVASQHTADALPGVHAYKKYYFVNIAKSFTDATYPSQASIDVTFTGDYDLPLEGGVKVALHELAHSGVSSTQTVAFIPSENALVVGDVVHHNAHAWLEGGIIDGKPVPDLASWSQALDELRAYRGATVFGGRGEAAPVETAVADEQAYLAKMHDIVTAYVAEVGAAEVTGPNANADYVKIADRAVSAFPDYQLRYMIEYGVYGLVNQVAAGAAK
jgi:glyoxylase-like metal-dependent hydrolase (beta-lactamase superfamily II)